MVSGNCIVCIEFFPESFIHIGTHFAGHIYMYILCSDALYVLYIVSVHYMYTCVHYGCVKGTDTL